MKKISIIGGGLIAYEFIKKIHSSNYKIDYYLPSSKFYDNKNTIDFCKQNNIGLTRYIGKLRNSDLIISAGNYLFLKEDFLTRNFVINFHGAPLPHYGGSAGPAFALIKKEKRFGCTFQKMIKDLDAGPILSRYYFDIEENMTSYDIDKKVIEYGSKNVLKTLNDFFDKKTNLISFDQKLLIINKRSELDKYQYIAFENLNKDDNLRIIKAFSWPGVLDPTYTIINNQRINLTNKGS